MTIPQQSIKRYVEALNVRIGDTYRGACPVCGGKNTLTVSKTPGALLWHCYRASCSLSGKGKTQLSLSEVTNYKIRDSGDTKFVVPTYWVSPLSNDKCLQYLRQHACVQAYTDKRADIRYDPKTNRCVFVVRHEGEIVGGAGRKLNPKDSPKWYMYSKADTPFICGTIGQSALGVIVEDATSAVAVSCAATGVALLGSKLQTIQKSTILRLPLKKLLIALDPDAASTAIDIQRELNFYIPTYVTLLDDDLKYANPEQIRKKLEKYQ